MVLVAAATLTVGVATADNHNSEKRSDRHAMMAERKTDQMARSLALTDVQKRAVHELNRQRADAFHAARHNSSLTAEQRQAHFDEADSLYRSKLKSILTPQQYDQWQANYNSAVMPRGKNARMDGRYRSSADACSKGKCVDRSKSQRSNKRGR